MGADRGLLEAHGCAVMVHREWASFVEAEVSRGDETVVMEWSRDSAYRFFPLIEHPDLGLALHPFDLATNKVLALVGRLEVRDWIDVLECEERLQLLGHPAWAACGKGPGFGPGMILEHAARAHYSRDEVAALRFAGDPPDAATLGRRWREVLGDARRVVEVLPPERAECCVLEEGGGLLRAAPDELADLLRAGTIGYHQGSIGGALPRLVDTADSA